MTDQPIDDDAAVDEETPGQASRGTRPTPAAASPAARPSIATAFRQAFHPVNLREDLIALPALLRHRSVWLPSLITLAVMAWVVGTGGASGLVYFAYAYFLVPPALGSVFIGGFLAPRASYLVGLIVGTVAAIAFGVTIAALPGSSLDGTGGTAGASPSPSVVANASPFPSGSPAASPAPSVAAPSASASSLPASPTASSPAASPTPAATPASVQDQVAYAVLTSPPFGMFFAAAAAWYRRFLRLSNPNRGRPQQRRGPDGKSRSNQRRR